MLFSNPWIRCTRGSTRLYPILAFELLIVTTRRHMSARSFLSLGTTLSSLARAALALRSANWVGPRRITRIPSDFTVELEHLLTEETSVVHISRVKPYAGSPVEMREISEFTDRVWYAVDKIKDVRETYTDFEALVSWKGLSTASDTWEPLPVMFEDVPTKVRNYLNRRRATATMRKDKLSLGL